MKTLFFLLIFLASSLLVKAQMMDNFFVDKGVNDLCGTAHPANKYLRGTYDIHSDYVDIEIVSEDNLFGGDIHTSLRLLRGAGGLYFSDIIVVNDDDSVKPFAAFALQTSALLAVIQAADQSKYNEMKQKIASTFNTNIEQWDGKMWTLFGLNLEYYQYILTH